MWRLSVTAVPVRWWRGKRNNSHHPSLQQRGFHLVWDGVRQGKAQLELELDLGRDEEGNLKGFCKDTVCTRHPSKENVISLLSGAGDVVTKRGERLRSSLPLLPCLFLVLSNYQASLAPKFFGSTRVSKASPMVENDVSGEDFCPVGTHKSMSADRKHPRVQGEVAGVTAVLLPIVYEVSW